MARLAGTAYLATATGLVTGPIMARVLGPSGRGEVAAGLMISGLATGVLSLGMSFAASYETAKRPPEDRARLLGSGIRYVAWVTPLALLAAILGAGVGLSDYEDSTRVIIGVLIAMSPIDVYLGILAGVFRGSGSLQPLGVIQLIPRLINLVVVGGLAAAGALTVSTVLAGGIATTVLTATYGCVAMGIRPRGSLPLGPLLRFASRGFVGSFGETISLRADQVVIAIALPSSQLGFYAVATTVAQVPRGLARALSARAFGDTAALDSAEALERVGRFGRISSVLSLGTIVVVAGVAPLVPVVFGEDFRDAIPPLLLLVPGAAGLVWSQAMSGQLAGLGRPGLMSLSRLPGFVVTIVGLPIVIPLWEIRGAATLSSLAYVTQAVTIAILLRRLGAPGFRPGLGDVAEVVAKVIRRPRPAQALP